MNNIRNEVTIIQLSIYCDIIMTILKNKKKLSVNKMVTYTYLLKKNSYNEKDVYNGKNTKELVMKSLSLLSGLGEDYFNNIFYILEAIDVLIKSKNIIIEDDMLLRNDKDYKVLYSESLFFQNAIDASDDFTDRQFLKEVLNNV